MKKGGVLPRPYLQMGAFINARGSGLAVSDKVT